MTDIFAGVDVQQLAARALQAWGIEAARIDLLKIRENCVLRITGSDGRRAAMRVHRPGYHSASELQSEFDWLNALRVHGIATPRAILSKSGKSFEAVPHEGGEVPWLIDLLEWIEGTQFGSVEGGIHGDPSAIGTKAHALGALSARLHAHGLSWARPKGFTRPAWDAAGLVGERPLWGRFWKYPGLTHSQISLLTRVRDAIREDLQRYGTAHGDFGLIHGDLVPENLLAEGGRLIVIDFDDAGEGWHLFDLATSLYFLKPQPYFTTILECLIDGYRSARPLSDRQLEMLPLFIAARATTYIGWMHTRTSVERPHPMASQLIDSACQTGEDYLANRPRW